MASKYIKNLAAKIRGKAKNLALNFVLTIWDPDLVIFLLLLLI